MSINKTTQLNNRQQLIDLNGDTVNFDINFTVSSKKGESFELLVVDQSTLDNNPQLEFQQVNGTISGNVRTDKNIYQNYFLCMRAPLPCDVDILINKQEIPPQIQKSHQPPEQKIKNIEKYQPQQQPMPKTHSIIGINIYVVLIGIFIIGLLVFLYYIYFIKGKNDDYTTTHTKHNISSEINDGNHQYVPTGNIVFDQHNIGGLREHIGSSNIIDRLNSLPIS